MGRIGVTLCNMTWNPWHGCRKVSAGCKNCYMYDILSAEGKNPAILERRTQEFAAPLTWTEPKTVYVCSLSDWFEPGADAWRGEAWDLIRRTPQHRYLILSKHVDRAADLLPKDWPLQNVYLGTSAENQEAANERLPWLIRIRATARFINVEPALGPIDFGPFLEWGAFKRWTETEWPPRLPVEVYPGPTINWIFVGCEAGPRARPIDLEWVKAIARRCKEFGVDFGYKQDMRLQG